MNADDRTPNAERGLYTPRPTEPTTGQVPARRAFMPVSTEAQVASPSTGQAPTRAAAPAQAPSSAQVPTASSAPTSQPQRTSVRPQSQASGIPTAYPPAAPTSPTAPIPQQDQGHARFDAAMGAGTAALGAGTAKIKGLAGRAAESFKAGDDLGVPSSKGGPRKARVLLSRIDPWSALKLGFLLSIAFGIMLVVAVFVVWNVLNGMGVFALVNEWVVTLFAQDSEIDIMQFVQRNKVMSAAILVAVVNVVLITALTTIGAFLYNVVSSVVGGVYVTLTDD